MFTAMKSLVTLSFTNGDQLSGRWASESLPFKTSFGQISIPCAQITRIGEIQAGSARANLALNKPVFGPNGASTDEGPAHVTDGDYDTHAKPPASHFSYRIDLREGEKNSMQVEELKITGGVSVIASKASATPMAMVGHLPRGRASMCRPIRSNTAHLAKKRGSPSTNGSDVLSMKREKKSLWTRSPANSPAAAPKSPQRSAGSP